MKTSQWHILRFTMLVIWGIFAFILTTQSDRLPLVHLMTTTIGSTELGDSIGHAGLFGVLTAAACDALSLRLTTRRALLLAMILALLVGTSTELYQFFVADRATSLSDMLSNWLGVFVVGFTVSFASLSRHPTKGVG